MVNRLPEWFKRPFPDARAMTTQKGILNRLKLHTICESALCPNIGECFERRTATFLILGDVCTRNCTFCAVRKGQPVPVDKDEPGHLAEAVAAMGLDYVVITSVTRDDLPDGGASHFARTIEALRRNKMSVLVEVLIPDFLGSSEALRTVVDAMPDVLNHNIETVPRLYPEVRAKADYNRSVELLYAVKQFNRGIVTKSGLMLGLGETKAEVISVMGDLREADCKLLTIGQYLRPSAKNHEVVRFVPPEEFAEYVEIGRKMGFTDVASAPLVRSSYKAADLFGGSQAQYSHCLGECIKCGRCGRQCLRPHPEASS